MPQDEVTSRLARLEATCEMLVGCLSRLAFGAAAGQPAPALAPPALVEDTDLNLATRERAAIDEALKRTMQNHKAAARLLGITERSLSYKLCHGVKLRRLKIVRRQHTA